MPPTGAFRRRSETPGEPTLRWQPMPDGDDLIISGGGSTAVGTDELFAAAGRLRSAETQLVDCAGELTAIDRLVGSAQLQVVGVPAAAAAAERAMDDAIVFLDRAHSKARLLSFAIDRSADAYGFAERAATRVSDEIAASIAYSLGFFLPLITLAAMPALFGIARIGGVAAAGLLALPEAKRAALFTALSGWLQQHSSVLSDPNFVTFVRHSVTSLDDLGAGLLHAPPAVSGFLGDGGIGLLGVPTSSAAIIGAGKLVGYLGETRVMTTQVSSTNKVTFPSGWEERATRVQHETGADVAQVRIDRYEVAGEPDRFEVYVSGTKDFALGKDTQPWDMTSNMNGIAGWDFGSNESVRQAMEQAGVTGETPVLFTGHSQGGLVAAQLAASGDFDTRGLYTIGAPSAQVAVPNDIPWLALEHTNDIVPALSGHYGIADPVLVRRDLYEGVPTGSDKFFPSHQLGAYESTAAMVDQVDEPRIDAIDRRFADFTTGATPVQSTTYHGIRILDRSATDSAAR
jgi:hypothetical protein